MLCCHRGFHKILKFLLDRKPGNLSQTDNHGKNAIFIAAENAKEKCVEAFLACKALSRQEMVKLLGAVSKGGETAVTAARDVTTRAQLLEAGGYDVRGISSDHVTVRYVNVMAFNS